MAHITRAYRRKRLVVKATWSVFVGILKTAAGIVLGTLLAVAFALYAITAAIDAVSGFFPA